MAQERLGDLGFLGARGEKTHQSRRSRNLPRQRANDLDAGLGDDLADVGYGGSIDAQWSAN